MLRLELWVSHKNKKYTIDDWYIRLHRWTIIYWWWWNRMVLIFFQTLYIYKNDKYFKPWWNSVFREIERKKTPHAAAQKNYRKRKSEKDPQDRKKWNQDMKTYNESKKNKYELNRKKLLNDASPNTVLIPSADEVIKTDRRTKRRKKQAST